MPRSAPRAHPVDDFDAIRLVAALAVLVAHAWPLTGTDGQPRFAGLLVAHLGVYTFFSVSGYLIARSWQRSPRVAGYLVRRVARIVPALAVVVLVTVLVLGPVGTSLPVATYFGAPETAAYLRGLVLAPTYALPGVFDDNPTPAVNGSLWSLGPEFVCYLVVLGVGLATTRLARRPAVRVAAFGALGVACGAVHLVTDSRAIADATGAMVFFMVGAVIAQRSRRLPLWPLVPALLAWAILGSILDGTGLDRAGLVGAWLVLPCAVIAVGSRSTPVVRSAGRFGDISYGLYLWGFPVQQVVVLVAPGIPLALDLVVVVTVTGLLAAGSWFLVERPAIAAGARLRDRLDARAGASPVRAPAGDPRRRREPAQVGSRVRAASLRAPSTTR